MALPGTHPEPQQANAIVLAAVAPEYPNATLLNTVGSLFPTAGARALFVSRIVQNLAASGFSIQPGQIPVDEGSTLQAISAFIVNNAVASEPQPDAYYCSFDAEHVVSRGDQFCPKCGAPVVKRAASLW
jgi:hypothetical protein